MLGLYNDKIFRLPINFNVTLWHAMLLKD